MKLENKKVAVIGFGLTGRAVVDFLLRKKAGITVFDEKDRSRFPDIEGLERKGVRFEFGVFNFEKMHLAELIVTSPGISALRSSGFRELKQLGKEIISEIEMAFRFFKGKLICITGTNGKSTTASLVHHLFIAAGRKSYLLGNIGIPFISEVENIRADEYAVVEVSCFQLEEIKLFKPDYVILTNITADHLDRYPSMESYIEIRKNIFKNITSEDKIILNFDDPLIEEHFAGLVKGEACSVRENPPWASNGGPQKSTPNGVYWFSRKSEVPRGTFLRGGNFIFRDKREISFFNLSDFPPLGIHNIENALAASLPPILEGVEMDFIRKGLKDFKGLKHRMEFVARFGGVDFINDSKATNVDAVLKAVACARQGISLNSTPEQIVIIMGGKDKGGTFSLLKNVLADTLAGTGTLKGTGKIQLILIGEAAPLIESQLNKAIRMRKAKTMKEAVRISFEEASPKGVVLLSPGCASFDMFNNFEQRGEVFKEEVRRLKEKKGEKS